MNEPKNTALTYGLITITRHPVVTHNGLPVYTIQSIKSSPHVGYIFWYRPWGTWVVHFPDDSAWSTDCLDCVKDAIEKIKAGMV